MRISVRAETTRVFFRDLVGSRDFIGSTDTVVASIESTKTAAKFICGVDQAAGYRMMLGLRQPDAASALVPGRIKIY